MPSMSGGALRAEDVLRMRGVFVRFYALDVGRGFARTFVHLTVTVEPDSFYALDVGRGFASMYYGVHNIGV